jgi:hypothetical protein
MKSNYLIWHSKALPNVCSLNKLTGVEKVYELSDGVALAANFPRNASYAMDPDFPEDTLLTDSFIDLGSRIVASKKLKEFLQSQNVPKVEYLPVTILNHKGKPASRDYFIVHTLDPVQCLDLGKCEPTWSRIDKTTIDRVKRLCLDETTVEKTRTLFRPVSYPLVNLVHRRLAEAIDKQEFGGMRWVELEEYEA